MLYTDVTGAQLIEATRQAAANDPDHTVNTCRYADTEGNPSCLVGRAFHALGVDLLTLPAEAIDTIMEETGTASEAEIAWLSIAQLRQDEEYQWDEAVAEADDTITSV